MAGYGRATWAGSGADGYLQLTGRSKELYKSGGELVMPKEIEELLSSHPGVSQVYVVGLPDERWVRSAAPGSCASQELASQA